LAESRGRDLTKEEILERIWPGQILEESNLTVNISAVRRALGEKASSPRYLVTIPGHGYRFVANVTEVDDHQQGVVIETETISQVTVEEEIDEDDAADSDGPALSAGAQPLQLAGAARRGFFRRPLAISGF